MKIRTMVLSCLISVVVLSMGYEYSRAESEADESSLKIGVVSIEKIFQDSKRAAKHDREATAEERRVIAELKKLNAEAEAERAKLGTLKTNSSDYLELERNVAQKLVSYASQKRFYERQLELKDQQWTGEFYEEILQITNEVAEQKDLDLVLERSEPDFSVQSTIKILLAIETHKLLYCRGCLDITDEVMARLDKDK